MSKSPELSIIVTVSDRADSIPTLIEAYAPIVANLDLSHEWIFVLDGYLEEIRKQVDDYILANTNAKLVQLGKSFGESTALSAGLSIAAGELILTLPAYLQCDPAELPKLFSEIEQADLCLARRWPRIDSGGQQSRTRSFGRLVQMLTGARFDDLGCGIRLVKRRVIEEVAIYGDQHRFFPVLVQRRGFRVKQVDLAQHPQDSARKPPPLGAYPRRLLDLLTVFFLVRFTKKPLRFFGLIGSSTAAVGMLTMLVVVVQRLFFDVGLAERPALLIGALLMVLGVQLLAIGLVGEIVIFTHAREMKEYTIEEIVENLDA